MAQPPRNRGGRPCLLTPQLQDAICKAIAIGALYKSAAQANGISYETFCDWMSRGRGEGSRRKAPMFVQFVRAVEQAQGQARVLTEGKLRTENPLQYLARRWPEDWGSSGDGEGASINVTVNIDRAEKLRILRSLTIEQRARLRELQGEMSELLKSAGAAKQPKQVGPREIETTAATLNGDDGDER